MGSTRGRQVVVPLTNKSGGGVIAGDVVIVDTANDESFTTTTSAGSLNAVGIAQETIADNAVGRVLIGGYAALVNTSAAVTRGEYGKTHTVAKQAVASASRAVGTFCRFLKSSATPSAYVYPVDLAGAALSDPMTTRGDQIYRNAANALDRLPVGAAGTFVGSDGTDKSNRLPPGHKWDYVEKTTNVSPTATTEGTADTVLASNSFTPDGADVLISFYSPAVKPDVGAAARLITLILVDSVLGVLGQLAISETQTINRSSWIGGTWSRKITLSAVARTVTVKAFVSAGTGLVVGGAGGSGANLPMHLTVSKW